MKKKIKIRIILLLIILYSLFTSVGFVYYFNKSNKLSRKIYILNNDDINYTRLNVQVFLEVLKKLQLSKEKILELFTFYDKCLLSPSDKNDLMWRVFDYDNLDTEYTKSHDEILYYNDYFFDLFFLFKKDRFIDYRYMFADREILKDFLKTGGQYEPLD